VAKRLISGIQAIWLMGASCIATVIGCPPDKSGHILTCLSHPPEKTVVPSSFQAEHKTFTKRYREYKSNLIEFFMIIMHIKKVMKVMKIVMTIKQK
jgi:hypothetical protein